jgi:predicted permease
VNWRARITQAFQGRTAPDDDVLEELAQHAASLYETARAEGSTPEAAIERVEAQVGVWAREAVLLRRRPRHEAAPFPLQHSAFGIRHSASSLWHDLRYSVRLLGHARGHASLVIATMALGMSAVTVLFSVMYGVLLKPLPWPDADRIVQVSEIRKGGAPRVAGTLSNGTYLAWRDRHDTIEEIGGWRGASMTLTGAGDAERIVVGVATPSLFTILKARPALGRVFVESDEKPSNVIVLSDGLWQERFGRRREAIGTTVRLDGDPFTIVGVMPAGFAFTDRESRAWIPFAVPTVLGDQGLRRMAIFRAIARLRPGVSPEQAAAEGTARGRSAPDPGMAAMALFGSNGPVEVSAAPALEAITAEVRPAIRLLFAAVILLLAVATANVAGLQLARATTRRREVAIRAAIGAGISRLSRQLLVENTLIGIVGGIAGLAFASVMLRGLRSALPVDFPRLEMIGIDASTVVFAAAVSVFAGLACSVLPALDARRVNLVASLADDGAAPLGAGIRSRTGRIRAAMMVGQVAAACLLLVGAALLTRSFIALQRADRGYDPANVLTARIPMSGDYPVARRAQVLDASVRRLAGIPGVRAVAYANSAPLISAGGYSAFTMRSPRRPDTTVSVEAAQRVVSPGYFSALRLRVLAGRPFTEMDDERSSPVVVVNRSFARRYLGEPAVGGRIPWQGPRAGIRMQNEERAWEVVGLIDDVRQGAVDAPDQPEIVAPYAQVRPETIRAFDPILIVRTDRDPSVLVSALRAAVREQDPTLAVDSVQTMEERIATSLARPRTYALLLAGFAGFAALISAVGLFGVLAYTVAQRAREIGVRAALGASPRAIVSLVVRQALAVTCAGLAAGLAAAYVSARLLAGFVYGVEVHDRISFAGVVVLLLFIAAIASIVPARRAARVDPLSVLK